jgi:ABC-type phosphate transport system substrate-binding protein
MNQQPPRPHSKQMKRVSSSLCVFKNSAMKINNFLSVSVVLANLVIAAPAFAADLYVTANSALTLSADEVRDVFLGEKQIANGAKLTPMDNASLQPAFLEKVIKTDAAKYSTIWTKKGFRDGLNPPTVKSGDAEMIAAVKSTPGAVGYVSSAPAGVKVVQKY